jgi:hydroxyacylglutathione hydrolase
MDELPVHTLQLPNPFVEGRNCVYVIPSDPLTLIDTGIATQRAFDSLVQGLAQLGFSLGDVGRIILTHKHIDHIGNAWRIQRQTGAEILIHESERDAVADVDPGGRRFAEVVRQRLREWNAPEEAVAASASAAGPRWEIESAAPTGVVEGQTITLGRGLPELEVIHTPGHTVGSICLKCGPSLFSGDHILPTISPNVGGGDLRHRGLLSDYLNSLERIAARAEGAARAFPGHGAPFAEWQGRCRELIEHHRERLERVRAVVGSKGGLTVYQIAVELFGDMQGFHVVLGCAEAESHLEYLAHQGHVVSADGRYGCV